MEYCTIWESKAFLSFHWKSYLIIKTTHLLNHLKGLLTPLSFFSVFLLTYGVIFIFTDMMFKVLCIY